MSLLDDVARYVARSVGGTPLALARTPGEGSATANLRVERVASQLEQVATGSARVTETSDGTMVDVPLAAADEVMNSAVIVDPATGRVQNATLRFDPPRPVPPTRLQEFRQATWDAAEAHAAALGIDARTTGHVGQADAPHAVIREPVATDDLVTFADTFPSRLEAEWPARLP